MEATRVRDDGSSAADDIAATPFGASPIPAGESAASTMSGAHESGFDSGAAPLVIGSRLLGCDVQGVIGRGGFGIVYSADDTASGRRLALREYLPASMVYRAADSAQLVVAPDHAETFGTGLRSFLNEARLLSRFDHPSLVKVLRFGQANGTACMLMPLYEGPTLEQALQQSDAPDEQQMRDWLDPLLDALKTLHKAHCIHRDIAPGNILLTPDGPLLLEFGAPRRVTGHAIARNEAPIEMSSDTQGARQGPWTDLYALACVAYGAITGSPPMPALQRIGHDALLPLSVIAAGRYSAGFLAALDRAMSVYPADRPQSAEAFWTLPDGPPSVERLHEGDALPPTAASSQDVPLSDFWTQPGGLPSQVKSRSRGVAFKALLLLLAMFVIGTALWVNGVGRRAPPKAAAVPPKATLPAPAAAATPPAMQPPAPKAPEAEVDAAPAPSPVEAVSAPGKPGSSFSLDVDEPLTTPPAIAASARTPAPRPGAGNSKAPAGTMPSTPIAVQPAAKAEVGKKCSEILQQASIEPLGSAQAAFLKRECQR